MFNKEMFPGEKIKHDSLELIEKGEFAEYYDPRSCSACGGEVTWTAAIVFEFVSQSEIV